MLNSILFAFRGVLSPIHIVLLVLLGLALVAVFVGIVFLAIYLVRKQDQDSDKGGRDR